VSPYLFKKPLAPSVAAEQEGKNINPVKIFKAFDVLSKRHDFMIVEGSGGILVPLSGRYTYLDFAKELGLPVLIVARPGLGTINHTLLTVSALRQCKLNIAGIVINHALDQKSGLTERTSPNVIENLSGIKILDIIQNGYRDFNNLLNKLT
jgi:dethiobiotin synthetase